MGRRIRPGGGCQNPRGKDWTSLRGPVLPLRALGILGLPGILAILAILGILRILGILGILAGSTKAAGRLARFGCVGATGVA